LFLDNLSRLLFSSRNKTQDRKQLAKYELDNKPLLFFRQLLYEIYWVAAVDVFASFKR
jgi:hypothetical protein